MRPTRHSTSSRWSGRRWSGVLWWCATGMSIRCWLIRGLVGYLSWLISSASHVGPPRILRPDLTVVLDAELSDGVHAKADKDRLESAGEVFHERTRQFFLELAQRDPERYLVLDARASREEIAAQVAARVAPLLVARAQR